jgi:hypothetical protein
MLALVEPTADALCNGLLDSLDRVSANTPSYVASRGWGGLGVDGGLGAGPVWVVVWTGVRVRGRCGCWCVGVGVGVGVRVGVGVGVGVPGGCKKQEPCLCAPRNWSGWFTCCPRRERHEVVKSMYNWMDVARRTIVRCFLVWLEPLCSLAVPRCTLWLTFVPGWSLPLFVSAVRCWLSRWCTKRSSSRRSMGCRAG